MKLDAIVAWYQKKIGTYDKQEWEKSVEQRILDGFNNVNLKNTKLKTELIDVDLVRGSTFPKAKPKQTLLTVIRLAILRYLLLPLYAQWWVKQTTPNAFGIILCLYITQMINWALYIMNSTRIHTQLSSPQLLQQPQQQQQQPVLGPVQVPLPEEKQSEEQADLLSALLIPMALSLLISLIHSQIVATNTNSAGSTKNKLRRFSANNNHFGSGSGASGAGDKTTTRDPRPRRRKKFIRNRQPDTVSDVSQGKSTTATAKATADSINVQPKSLLRSHSEETFLGTTAVTIHHHHQQQQPNTQQGSSSPPIITQISDPISELRNVDNTSTSESPQKKRNVNWHTPIQSCTTFEKSEQPLSDMKRLPPSAAAGAASTANANATPTSSYQMRRNIGEDDGFESLNGKSSSGEDNNQSPPIHGTGVLPSTISGSCQGGGGQGNQLPAASSQLRLRLNVTPSSSNTAAANTEKKSHSRPESSTSCAESDECDDADIISSPVCNNECTTSATDWLGVTTNSDDCSYTSELEHSENYKHQTNTDEEFQEFDITPTTILNPHSTMDRISCTVWDQRDTKKAQLSVLEIASCIIDRVDSMGETNDYIYIGVCFSILLTLIPTFCRLCEITIDADKNSDINYFYMPMLLWEKSSASLFKLLGFAFGDTGWERAILALGFVQRLCLTLILFIIFAVAERTFKQRFLYAKLFSHLTSSRRARKSNLPHFRLNKVRNIKTWLSVRSYLKKRGPQRSVDIIVSAAFIVTLLLLAFLSVEWLKDSVHLHSHLTLEALLWSITIGIFLLRFMTLGNKIQDKYRSVSVLITEQINLYLQIEQKPKKKEELMVSNSVLKLASDLLKELETPFKISGLSANPYLFTTIKVVILSALSGVLSEVLGFKLKLHKIKIK